MTKPKFRAVRRKTRKSPGGRKTKNKQQNTVVVTTQSKMADNNLDTVSNLDHLEASKDIESTLNA